jgi:hypothetical protein
MPRKSAMTAVKTKAKQANSAVLSAAEKRALNELMNIPDVETEIRKVLPILLDRMLSLALGVHCLDVKVNKETGQPEQKVFRLPPDRQALQFLIENVIGKVPQRLEMTGKDGGPVEIIPWMPMVDAAAQGLLGDGGGPVVIEDDPNTRKAAAAATDDDPPEPEVEAVPDVGDLMEVLDGAQS